MMVAVLGSGPAGVMAAHACQLDSLNHDTGFDIITDNPEPSRMGGAQYLHVHVPGMSPREPEAMMTISKLGTAEGYGFKMARPEDATSWHRFNHGDVLPIWNLGKAYQAKWESLSQTMIHRKVDSEGLEDILRSYDLVLSTIPKNVLCTKPSEHKFLMQQVYLTRMDTNTSSMRMTYNGIPSDPWYRSSGLFGVFSVEYADPPRIGKPVAISKPLSNTCDCGPAGLHFLGRYGAWDRQYLSHDAFFGAKEILDAMH